jgi:hypothetical protein
VALRLLRAVQGLARRPHQRAEALSPNQGTKATAGGEAKNGGVLVGKGVGIGWYFGHAGAEVFGEATRCFLKYVHIPEKYIVYNTVFFLFPSPGA